MGEKYQMQVKKPGQMDRQAMLQLKGIFLAPYMQLATALIGKARFAGGNMFRHQIDTMGILIDYGYIDSVLLKASCIHDVIEDIPGFDQNLILQVDEESEQVYRLVLEVTKKAGQGKPDYLRGIIEHGSQKAKILKCAEESQYDQFARYDPKFIDAIARDEYFIFPLHSNRL